MFLCFSQCMGAVSLKYELNLKDSCRVNDSASERGSSVCSLSWWGVLCLALCHREASWYQVSLDLWELQCGSVGGGPLLNWVSCCFLFLHYEPCFWRAPTDLYVSLRLSYFPQCNPPPLFFNTSKTQQNRFLLIAVFTSLVILILILFFLHTVVGSYTKVGILFNGVFKNEHL